MTPYLSSVPGYAVLEALNQHRYLTLRQAKRYLNDHSPDGKGPTRDLLQILKRKGLVEGVPVEARGANIWFLSEKGLKAIPRERRREYVPTATQAGGMDHRHTWAVNEAGLAFVEAARTRDDECGVTALEHEIKLRDTGTVGSLVIADGIMQYVGDRLLPGSRGLEFCTFVLEVDRTSMPIKIANRLRAYSEIKRKKALWGKVLPDGWPPVLFVISDDFKPRPRAGERWWAGDPVRSAARSDRLCKYIAKAGKTDKYLADLDVLFCPLPALIQSGPFAPIWHRPGHPESVDWVGKPVMVLRKGGAA